MRHLLLTLTLAGLCGALLLSSDASACCHKIKCAQPTCTPTCAPAPAPAPAPACEPVACPPKKCGLFGGHKLFGCCHKQKCAAPPPPPTPVCEVAPACPAPIPCSPCAYPSYQAAPSPQVMPSMQVTSLMRRGW
jgi:hypothetical protein